MGSVGMNDDPFLQELEAKGEELKQAVDTIVQVLSRKRADVQTASIELQHMIENGALSEQEYQPPDLLTLNVGGDELRVFRRTLTLRPETRLAWMFSGRWDHVLPRDRAGRIFLDLDVRWFSPIVDFLAALSKLEGASAAAAARNSSDNSICSGGGDWEERPWLPLMRLGGDARLGCMACAALFGLTGVIPERVWASVLLGEHVRAVARLGQAGGPAIGWHAPWTLLYQASRDGADVRTFHQLCDGKRNVVCLGIGAEGNVLGGFTSVGWSSPPDIVATVDPAAFLFTLMFDGEACARRYGPSGRDTNHIRPCATIFPLFGYGSDLYFNLAGEGSRPQLQYFSKAATYAPLPMAGRGYQPLRDIVIWQVPRCESITAAAAADAGGSAPPSRRPSLCTAPPSEGPAGPEACTLVRTAQMTFRCDLGELAAPARALGCQALQWLKATADAVEADIVALRARSELFGAEAAFMRQFHGGGGGAARSSAELAELKRTWLAKCAAKRGGGGKGAGEEALPPLRGAYNDIVYVALANRPGRLCVARVTFAQLGACTHLAAKYASEHWRECLANELMDDEGCIFEDHDPECFAKIVNVLRLRALVRRGDVGAELRACIGDATPSPMPDHRQRAMAHLLEYLNIPAETFYGPLGSD